MARKKAPEKAPNHERWLVSYADFITLLFAVFVTLYAMSQVDKRKVEEVAASYRSAFGLISGTPPGKVEVIPNSNPLVLPSERQKEMNRPSSGADEGNATLAARQNEYRELRASLDQLIEGDKKIRDNVEVELTTRGLVISLKAAGLFKAGSAKIRKNAYPLLRRIADILQPLDPRISFEGNTDSTPVNSPQFHSNWELSVASATSVAEYFLGRYDFSPEKLSITGYGQYHPVADNSTEKGRERNRRVDIVLLGFPSDSDSRAPPL